MTIFRVIGFLVSVFVAVMIAAQLRLLHFRGLILKHMERGEDYTLRELKARVGSESAGVWVALCGLVKDGKVEREESGRYELYRLKD